MTRLINLGRLILATIIAPFIGSFLIVLAFAVFGGGILEITEFRDLRLIVRLGGIIAQMIGWPTMVIIGLPLHWWLCRKNQRHWARYAMLGAIGGLVPALLFSITDGAGALLLLPVGAFAGAFTAVLFHIIRGPHLAATQTSP